MHGFQAVSFSSSDLIGWLVDQLVDVFHCTTALAEMLSVYYPSAEPLWQQESTLMLQAGMSITARLQSIIPNRNGSRASQHGLDKHHGLGDRRPPHHGQREESHHFFGPNHSDNTIPMLIDMGFHK